MKKFAFISRHTPTAEQVALAQELEIELVPVGDTDGFTVTPQWVVEQGKFDGVCVVHTAMALRLQFDYEVLLFENANRAAEGEKPQFQAVKAVLFGEAKILKNYKHWYESQSQTNVSLNKELSQIHEILDNLRNSPPRFKPKTYDDQTWQDNYDVVTRLATWLGSAR